MEPAISYVSLALSLTAFFLFVYNGFEDAQTVHRDTRLVETSKVWHYNSTSGVASLDENIQIACVGVSPSECEQMGGTGSAKLVVSGGLMLGADGPVLRGTTRGRVRLEDSLGKSILLADLTTGAVLVVRICLCLLLCSTPDTIKGSFFDKRGKAILTCQRRPGFGLWVELFRAPTRIQNTGLLRMGLSSFHLVRMMHTPWFTGLSTRTTLLSWV